MFPECLNVSSPVCGHDLRMPLQDGKRCAEYRQRDIKTRSIVDGKGNIALRKHLDGLNDRWACLTSNREDVTYTLSREFFVAVLALQKSKHEVVSFVDLTLEVSV